MPADMTLAEIEELKELAGKATEGPWTEEPPDYFGDITIAPLAGGLAVAAIPNAAFMHMVGKLDEHRANAGLIAASRSAVPALCDTAINALARVKELEAENRRLRGSLEYILTQARQGYPTVLSVIKANAAAALDDEWQATYRRARAALEQS